MIGWAKKLVGTQTIHNIMQWLAEPKNVYFIHYGRPFSGQPSSKRQALSEKTTHWCASSALVLKPHKKSEYLPTCGAWAKCDVNKRAAWPLTRSPFAGLRCLKFDEEPCLGGSCSWALRGQLNTANSNLRVSWLKRKQQRGRRKHGRACLKYL